MRKHPILVHFVVHPKSAESLSLARAVHIALNEDPGVPGLRVPTVFCHEGRDHAPILPDLDEADRDFFVPLCDAKLCGAEDWCRLLATSGNGALEHHTV